MKKYDEIELFSKLMENLGLPESDYTLQNQIDIFADSKSYHIIDGEESDYGEIYYYCITPDNKKELVCKYTNQGGDSEWYDFTEFGVTLFRNDIINYVNNLIDKQIVKDL